MDKKNNSGGAVGTTLYECLCVWVYTSTMTESIAGGVVTESGRIAPVARA